MECKSLRESGDDIRAYDVAYFAASVDTADTIAKFAKSLDADYPMLADVDGSVAKAYGVVSADRPYPQRWTFYIGADGKLVSIDKSVKPASAGPDVARRL